MILIFLLRFQGIRTIMNPKKNTKGVQFMKRSEINKALKELEAMVRVYSILKEAYSTLDYYD